MSDDYEVGYKKPPKHTQFKPGQSGNPKGRPKGSKNFGTSLQEILNEGIDLTQNGERRRVTKGDAILHRVVFEAVKGDLRAANKVFDLLKATGQLTPPAEPPDDAGPEHGVLLTPAPCSTPEEWERLWGEIARGKPWGDPNDGED